jgi:hypothetical protein
MTVSLPVFATAGSAILLFATAGPAVPPLFPIDTPRTSPRESPHITWSDAAAATSKFFASLSQAQDAANGPTDWHEEALEELQAALEEVSMDGLQPPSDLAVDNARLLLDQLRYFPRLPAPAVYATADGEIAISFGAERSMVLLLCDSEGGVACFASINGSDRHRRYPTAAKLPDSFVNCQLQDLRRIADRG